MSTNNIDDLLAIIEEDASPKKEDSPQESKRQNKKVIRFIKEKEIKVGTVKIPTYIIYYHFAQWCSGERPGKTEFFRTFSQFFEQKRNTKQRYYLLNDSLEIGYEIEQKANHFKSKRKTVRGKK